MTPKGEERKGFDFELCKRNGWLEKQGLKGMKPWSTGTTIAGIVFKVSMPTMRNEGDKQKVKSRTQEQTKWKRL